MSAEPESVQKPRSDWVVKVMTGFVIVTGLAAFLYFVLILPAAIAERNAGRRSICTNNLRNIAIALDAYQSAHGVYPPAFIADADGKPMHSWRVLILPLLGEKTLYEQYNFDEPWNGPNNSKLADKLQFNLFHCPTNEENPHSTGYVAVVGDETMWPTDKSMSISTINAQDGSMNTLMLVETADPTIHWMEPRDLTFAEVTRSTDPPNSATGIGSRHPEGVCVAYAACNCECLPIGTTPEKLRALLTVNGKEKPNTP